MSSQNHLPHCRVLPAPGEFNVIIPELRVTLQGAATWRIQWHVIPEPRVTLQGRPILPLGEFTVMIPEPRATLQGVRIPSAILNIFFRHIFLFFLMQFGLWRAAAFVSSPIHLFIILHSGLYAKLLHKGVNVNFMKWLQYWYGHLVCAVMWNSVVCDPFHILCGVRQGSVLSPLLFSIGYTLTMWLTA